jgi:hypothetical protein
MVPDSKYNLFIKILEEYGPEGFTGMDPADPLMVELDKMMEKNDQFFYIGDLIKLKTLYTIQRSLDMMGVEPAYCGYSTEEYLSQDRKSYFVGIDL